MDVEIPKGIRPGQSFSVPVEYEHHSPHLRHTKYDIYVPAEEHFFGNNYVEMRTAVQGWCDKFAKWRTAQRASVRARYVNLQMRRIKVAPDDVAAEFARHEEGEALAKKLADEAEKKAWWLESRKEEWLEAVSYTHLTLPTKA